MNAVTARPDKIVIDEAVVDDVARTARAPEISGKAVFVVRNPDGTEIELPESVKSLVRNTLLAVAEHGSATIGAVPEELTSTAAAEILGVSRPTLMKWSSSEKIRSFRVGTHTRFSREEVLQFRDRRLAEQRKAFSELRELDLENVEEIAD